MGAIGRFAKGFYFAWQGLVHVFRYERNARIHLLFSILVFMAGLYFHISAQELAAVFFAVIIVFLAEIFNTAIEKTLDLIDSERNHKIMVIKDMSAGAVLVAAFAAVAVGVVIFAPHMVGLWAK